MVDLIKLRRVFVDEAMERIGELEEGLLQLEKRPDDRELLNIIFRAAHTIKGSSSTIGLKDIGRFTHAMEEVLELVRQSNRGISKDFINLLLDVTDMIKEMVESVASDTEFDFSRCEELIKRMEEMKQNRGSEDEMKTEGPELETQNPELKIFKIIFIPSPDLFKRGIDPSVVINDLKEIGEIVSIKGNTDNVPLLSEMDPENLYMRWDILLKTNRKESEIRNLFEFVEDGSEIRIMPASSSKYEEYITPVGKVLVDEGIVKGEDLEKALKTQKRIGEILVEQGKVSPEDIEKALEKQNHKKIESFRNSVASTIKVDLRKLDHLINVVGEMVIVHSMFQQAFHKNGGAKNFDHLFSQLQRIGKDIQESAMSLRMLPVGEVFQRFRRLVRDFSASKNKSIELIITGEDTELDKGVLEKIVDPLVHLIRNSIDHGIETPEERLSKGKPQKGTIHLSAYQMGDSVYIDVEDDGRGLNKEKILQKAISMGIISHSRTEDMTDDQIYSLIFQPGLSTADAVTDISGRGVGMDVVKNNIESLNGRIYIRTKQDEGTTISIKLPLTLAIIDGLTVLIGEEVFVIPITSVVESLRPNRMDVKSLNEKGEVINVRGEYIPLIRLYEILGITSWMKNPWDAIVIVTMHEGRKYGLLVDELMGEQQIVIKNLGSATPRVSGIGGGTILGDGRVALVLDVPGIVETTKM